ncbi:MAG: hypothetical protein IT320_18640 [Anaerolineae bacterium]|nr:hypothetical protein [Anaerolineae bacterium]
MTAAGGATLTYDDNGNLTSDGANAYVWDRANRLLEVDNGTPAELTAYAYDGLNNRISQAIGTSSPVVTQYLLDTQPGLVKVLAATTGGNTDRYIHGPRGIHAMEDNAGNWIYAVQDALGNVRSEVGSFLAVQGSRQMTPYLTPFDEMGSFAMPFVGTGEMRDPIGIQYHRARYLNPSIGTFLSLDPFEGVMNRPMSLNGYMYVEGNVSNAVDPSGMQCGDPYAACQLLADLTGPCPMRDSNGKVVLSVTAVREGLVNDEHSWVALMLMQINAFQFPDPNTGATGLWRTIGQYDHAGFLSLQLPFQGVTQRVKTLAGLLVNGYCANGDPLAFFYSSDPTIRNAVRTVYPVVADYLDGNTIRSGGLRDLSRHPELSFEVSFDQTRIDQLQQDIAEGTYDNPYIVLSSAGGILVGTSSVTDLNIFYQCAIGESAVLKAGEIPGERGKREGRDFDCVRCENSTRIWYWSDNWSNGQYEELSEDEFQTRILSSRGGSGYVKSCRPL